MKDTDSYGIIKRVQADEELRSAWEKLSEPAREMFREIDQKKRVPDILNDVMFMGVFDPEVRPEWLSKLISSVIGREVKVITSLVKEGRRRSVHSKGVIMDIPVQFLDVEADGEEIADVEIQRKGINLPPKRSAVYSSELVTRQYSTHVGERKSDVNYDIVHPVHMIVIMEESPSFLKNHVDCQHHFRQISDTGIVSCADFELLQYYHYILLDVFRERRPHVAKLLENWMSFLSIRDVEEMMVFLSENSEFQPIYQRAVDMLADRKELLLMFQSIFENEDIAGSINRTNESIIKRLERKNERLNQQLNQVKHEKGMELKKKDQLLNEKDQLLDEKDSMIEELQRQLAEANSK